MSISGAPASTLGRRWLLVTWVICISAGALALIRYDLRAGPATTPPGVWPADSRLPHGSRGPTLVMFSHPRCPCTRAGLAELNRLLGASGKPVQASVVFIQPEGMSDEWVRSSLWEAAAAIPGVTCVADAGLREAAIFRAETSGQVLLYDASGRLTYSGGITIARGHEGANRGAAAIAALLAGRPEPVSRLPVFGCPLFDTELNDDATCCRLGGKACPSP